MEDRTANLISISVTALLIILILVARALLKLCHTFYFICGAAVAAIFAVLAVALLRIRFASRRRVLEKLHDSQSRELRIEYSFLRKVAGAPILFRHRDLELATDGFQSLLGRGGSASVFKGILSDGKAVAVKRLDGEGSGKKAFEAEVAVIASIQHVNLVQLLGYSVSPTGQRLLVYDFIGCGSLDNWIFPKRPASSGGWRSGCLPWDLRCRAALDVAKALSYLHHDCRSCILHLDVKPENILIDENFRAVVSDFGISKLKRGGEARIVTKIQGTKGYLAPEWLMKNGVTEKCDVYSYGIVLLEIISGRRCIFSVVDSGQDSGRKKFEYFPKIVAAKLRDGKLYDIVDKRLIGGGAVMETELKKMVRMALWCIQDKAKIRPTMAEVVEMLEGYAPVEDPPENKMLMADLLSGDDEHDARHASRADDDHVRMPCACSIALSTFSVR